MFQLWNRSEQGLRTSRAPRVRAASRQRRPIVEPLEGRALMAAQLGMNLTGISYYGTGWPFKDLVKSSSWWQNNRPVQFSDPEGRGVQVDPAGYPAGLHPSQTVYIYLGQGVGLPSGGYQVQVRGTGRIKFEADYAGGGLHDEFAVSGLSTFTLNVAAPPEARITMILTESNPEDYLRDIKVMMPGFSVDDPEVWHPDFLASIPGDVVRLMDMGSTNRVAGTTEPNIVEWADRTTVQYTYENPGRGIAPEIVPELARRAAVDPWINIPHTASDDYVRQYARLLRDQLPADRKVYVEYSNETWNFMFNQAIHVLQEARRNYPGLVAEGDEFQAVLRQHARRSKQIHDIFAAELGGESRLVRVLATQGLPHPPTVVLNEYVTVLGGPPPALAVGAYIGDNIGHPTDAERTKAGGVDGVLDYLVNQSIPEVANRLAVIRATADSYGSRLLVYEGGISLVGIGAASGDDDLMNLFIAVNRDQRIADVVRRQLDTLLPFVDVFAWFSHVGQFGRYGSWGTLEYQTQPLSAAPKLRALIEYVPA